MPLDKSQRVTRLLVARALAGEPAASRWLAQIVITFVDRQIRALLRRLPAYRNRDVVEELVHDVAVRLYENDGKLLLYWDESRGSFEFYVGLIARRLTIRRINQFRHNPNSVTPVDDIQAFMPWDERFDDDEMTYVLALDRVLRHVEQTVSASDWTRFRARFLEGTSVDALAKREGVSANSIHAWSCRLRKRLREQLPEVMQLLESLTPAGPPPGGGVKE